MVVLEGLDEKTYQVLTDLKEGKATPDKYVEKRDWLKGQGVNTKTIDDVLTKKGIMPPPPEPEPSLLEKLISGAKEVVPKVVEATKEIKPAIKAAGDKFSGITEAPFQKKTYEKALPSLRQTAFGQGIKKAMERPMAKPEATQKAKAFDLELKELETKDKKEAPFGAAAIRDPKLYEMRIDEKARKNANISSREQWESTPMPFRLFFNTMTRAEPLVWGAMIAQGVNTANTWAQMKYNPNYFEQQFKASNLKGQLNAARTAYGKLGLHEGAKPATVQKQFGKLARKFHPDTGSKGGDAKRLQEIVEAKKFLVDFWKDKTGVIKPPPKAEAPFGGYLQGKPDIPVAPKAPVAPAATPGPQIAPPSVVQPPAVPPKRISPVVIGKQQIAETMKGLSPKGQALIEQTVKEIDQDVSNAKGTGIREFYPEGEEFGETKVTGIPSQRPKDIVSKQLTKAGRYAIARERLENGYTLASGEQMPPDVDFLAETGQLEKAREIDKAFPISSVEEYNNVKEALTYGREAFDTEVELSEAKELVKLYDERQSKLGKTEGEAGIAKLPKEEILKPAAGPEYEAEQRAITDKQARDEALAKQKAIVEGKRQKEPLTAEKSPLFAEEPGVQKGLFQPKAATTDQPHKMTLAAFVDSRQGGAFPLEVIEAKNIHEQAVKQAFAKGEVISPEVLKDYPGLKAKPPLPEHLQKIVDKERGFSVKEVTPKEFASTGAPQPPKKIGPEKKPLITRSQKLRTEKAKQIKEKQLHIESAEEAQKTVHKMIRDRVFAINLANYETNRFVNDLKQSTTPKQREILPFIIEKTDVPKALDRPDLIKAYDKDKEKLIPIALQIKQHFNESWEKIKANTENLSAQQIEDYVTHIWDIPKAKKQMITNWFTTQNRFLKKRFITTLKEGIEKFDLKPRILDIAEIINVHDNLANKVIENAKFVKDLKTLTYDGVPLVARADKAPQHWAYFDHPALKQGMVIPGKLQKGEKISDDLQDILYDMGVAIGRRISPTTFGRPTLAAGKYVQGGKEFPPEVRFQRFMENSTIAHEIGHHLDKTLKLGKEFLEKYKTELYAINKERIEAHKGKVGKYGQKYAESAEEQIAEFFAFMFTDPQKTHDIAPNAMADAMSRLKEDGVLTKLVDLDFEKNAKNLIEEQLNTLVKLPIKVHPDLEKPLKVIFDSRIHHPAIQAFETLNGLLKKSTLSISLFHHTALLETGVATMGPLKTAQIAFNPVKIYKALARNELDVYKKAPIARDAVGHGLQLGATADIPVNRIQNQLNDLARKTKNVPLINRTTRFIKTFNEMWDKALWDYFHDSLKLYGYESLVSKHLDPTKSVDKQKEEIAQFVNDTFGGQNWETLMVSPKSLQVMSWALLSPDWTTSTLRQALSPTGLGTIHKETANLRRKLGYYFWIKAGLYFGVGMNVLNYMFRKWDEEENPKYYKDEKRNFWSRTMFGNTVGKKTQLFTGRYSDGSERYTRWGKQFRELPEMFYDETGFSPVSASLKKMGGKTSPGIQLFSRVTTGVSPSGFRDRDVYGRRGWERVWGISKTLMKSPLPFSLRSLTTNKEFAITDLAMPSSKGMSRSRSMGLFKTAIEQKDERLLKEVYQGTLRNGLPAFTLFSAALSSLKAEATKDLNRGIRTREDVDERIKELDKKQAIGIGGKERRSLIRKKKRIIKEDFDIKKGTQQLDRAIKKMEEY